MIDCWLETVLRWWYVIIIIINISNEWNIIWIWALVREFLSRRQFEELYQNQKKVSHSQRKAKRQTRMLLSVVDLKKLSYYTKKTKTKLVYMSVYILKRLHIFNAFFCLKYHIDQVLLIHCACSPMTATNVTLTDYFCLGSHCKYQTSMVYGKDDNAALQVSLIW